MILNNDSVLLDVIDPEKKKKLDSGADPRDIWHDDDDDDDDDDVEMVKGIVLPTPVLDTLQGRKLRYLSTSSTSASLYPVSPQDNTFALPTEVFSSCLAIV